MRGLTLAAAILVGVSLSAQTAPPDAADLARRLQARYVTIRDFTADFSQSYQGILRRQAAVERGVVQVKKPSRVRFTYSAPERKIFVSDGTRFYSYFPADRAGTESPLPKDDEAPTALLFLAGRGDLTRDFTHALATSPPGEWHLRLTPRSPQADFDTLTLIVDRATLALRGFITVDDQGTNTVRFTQLRENVGLTDAAFAFKFPPGTEISR